MQVLGTSDEAHLQRVASDLCVSLHFTSAVFCVVLVNHELFCAIISTDRAIQSIVVVISFPGHPPASRSAHGTSSPKI